jgi:hypothetical protein
MKLSDEAKDIIEKIRLFAGNDFTFDQVKKFFDFLLVCIIYDYIEDKPTTIPYLGSIFLKYDGDKVVAKGKEAEVSLQFTPDYNIKKIIGQIVDKDDTEIEKLLRTMIKKEFEIKANEE